MSDPLVNKSYLNYYQDSKSSSESVLSRAIDRVIANHSKPFSQEFLVPLLR